MRAQKRGVQHLPSEKTTTPLQQHWLQLTNGAWLPPLHVPSPWKPVGTGAVALKPFVVTNLARSPWCRPFPSNGRHFVCPAPVPSHLRPAQPRKRLSVSQASCSPLWYVPSAAHAVISPSSLLLVAPQLPSAIAWEDRTSLNHPWFCTLPIIVIFKLLRLFTPERLKFKYRVTHFYFCPLKFLIINLNNYKGWYFQCVVTFKNKIIASLYKSVQWNPNATMICYPSIRK